MQRLINRRARLTRQDGTTTGGWIDSHRGEVFGISGDFPDELGSVLQCVAYGTSTAVAFRAKVIERTVNGLVLNIDSGLELRPHEQEPRIACNGMSASILLMQGPVSLEVCDVSMSGFGCTGESELKMGFRTACSITAGATSVNMVAEVRYSRSLEDGKFRSGFRIIAMDRLNQGKWNSLMRFMHLAEAA